jgi:hypothetical protein
VPKHCSIGIFGLWPRQNGPIVITQHSLTIVYSLELCLMMVRFTCLVRNDVFPVSIYYPKLNNVLIIPLMSSVPARFLLMDERRKGIIHPVWRAYLRLFAGNFKQSLEARNRVGRATSLPCLFVYCSALSLM